MTALSRDLTKEDFDFSNNCSSNYMNGGNGSDIFQRINSMLDNTLELSNIAAINNEQAKHGLPQLPHVIPGPHSQQGTSYNDSQYNNSSAVYPGFQMFYQSAGQQPQQQQYNNQPYSQYKGDQYASTVTYKHDPYQSLYKPAETYMPSAKETYFSQKATDMYNHPYSKSMVDTNSTQYKIESMMALAKAAASKETPSKQSRAIRGSPCTSDYSDYESSHGTPGSTSTSSNDTLSPIEQIFGLMSGSRQKNRIPSPYDSDTSGHSSEGSEAALLEMMNALKLSNREASSPINDLSKQLFTAQQQQQQHQQASLKQQHQQVQQQQQAQQQQQQQCLVPYQQAQVQALQQQQQQMMAVQQAANQLALQPSSAVSSSTESLATKAPGQAIRPYVIANLDPYAIDRAARLHRSAAGNAMCEASCTWSGKIPPKNYKNPTTFSCKVFLGGVPWDITEAGLQASFNKFGSFKIEWPGRDGYVYLLFESEKAVRTLLQECTHDFSTGEYYYNISSRRMRSKEVQAIPWMLSDSNFVRQPSQRLDANKTVFVGALHGMISAETLSDIMNDLFGNVVYAGIDSDKHKYPIGSGRVTFSTRRSYMRAVQAAFVEIKTPKFTKKIQIDPYLEDSICSMCYLQQGPYFCRDLQCFKYFCRTCWYWKHEPDHMRTHKPLSRNTKGHATLGLM